jgi:hypothetical protein
VSSATDKSPAGTSKSRVWAWAIAPALSAMAHTPPASMVFR